MVPDFCCYTVDLGYAQDGNVFEILYCYSIAFRFRIRVPSFPEIGIQDHFSGCEDLYRFSLGFHTGVSYLLTVNESSPDINRGFCLQESDSESTKYLSNSVNSVATFKLTNSNDHRLRRSERK